MSLLGSEQSINIIIKAKDKASSVFDNLESKVKKTSRSFTDAGKKMTAGLTVPIAALGTAAVKAASDFEVAMGNLQTLYGENTDAVTQIEKGIKEMLKTVPKSAEDMGASAYSIVSAGITDATKALEVLEASAKLGVAGLGDTADATTLMVLAMNNFRDSGLDADGVANLMFKTVKNGITTVAELSQSFGLVAPLAVNAEISIQELQAATAALTQVNKSASTSQNSIKAALVALGTPTANAIELFEKLGVKTFGELVKKTGGMVNAFEAMQEASEGNEATFAGAIGSGEALSSVLALLGSQSESFNTALADMNSGTDALTTAFDTQADTFAANYQILKNNLNVALAELGKVILPLIQDIVVNQVIPAIQKLASWWEELSPKTQKIIIVSALLVATLGPLLIVIGGILALLPAMAAGFAILAGPVGIIIGIIAGLTYIIWSVNESIKILQEDWDMVWLGIKTTIKETIDWIIENPIKAIIKALASVISMITQVTRFGGIGIAFSLVGGLLSREHGGLVPGAIGQAVPIIAHGGERVIPASQGNRGGGGSYTININNPVVSDRNDLSAIRAQIESAMRDVVRNNKLQTS